MLRGIYEYVSFYITTNLDHLTIQPSFVFLDNKDPSTKVTRQDEVAKNLTELTRQIDRHLRATSGSVVSHHSCLTTSNYSNKVNVPTCRFN